MAQCRRSSVGRAPG